MIAFHRFQTKRIKNKRFRQETIQINYDAAMVHDMLAISYTTAASSQ